jgi:hypothetical protein
MLFVDFFLSYLPLTFVGQPILVNRTTSNVTCLTLASELDLYSKFGCNLYSCCEWTKSVDCVIFHINCSKSNEHFEQALVAAKAMCPFPANYSSCEAFPVHIHSSSFVLADELVQFINRTFPGLIGGIFILFGIRRRFKQIGALSIQLKFVAGIGLSGVVYGCASILVFSCFRSDPEAAHILIIIGSCFIGVEVVLVLGISIVLAIVIHDPVRYYNKFNRGINPFPRASVVLTLYVVLHVFVFVMALFVGNPWYFLLYSMFAISLGLFFGAPSYCIWKLAQGEWRFEPTTKAKLLHHLLTVCVVNLTVIFDSFLLFFIP